MSGDSLPSPPVNDAENPPPGAASTSRPWALERRVALAVAALTLAGLLLRMRGITDSYFGDELYTVDILAEPTLGGVIDRIQATESTPPLYYVLAWLSGRAGDMLEMGRLPSIVFGTLAIPATLALGRRTVSPPAAVVGAAVVAFVPTAIFYSTEARAYAVLLFFATTALVLLLRAAERGELRSWAAFVACAALALYSHYTAAFPLAAGLAWVFLTSPQRRRATVIAAAATALLYLPWVPRIVANPLLELGTPVTVDATARFVFRLVAGHPYVTLPQLPGIPALLVLGASVIAAGAVMGLRSRRRLWPPPNGVVLLLVTGLATPAGLLVYSVIKTDIFQPRYLLAALPMYALLLGGLLTAPRGRVAVIAGVAAVAAIAVGALQLALDDAWRRPAYAQAADYVERAADRRDVVAEVPLFLGVETRHTVLDLNLPPSRRVAVALPVRLRDGSYGVVLADDEWDRVRRGQTMFVVTPRAAGRYATPPPPRGLRVRIVRRTVFDGFIPVAVIELRRADLAG